MTIDINLPASGCEMPCHNFLLLIAMPIYCRNKKKMKFIYIILYLISSRDNQSNILVCKSLAGSLSSNPTCLDRGECLEVKGRQKGSLQLDMFLHFPLRLQYHSGKAEHDVVWPPKKSSVRKTEPFVLES